MNSFESRRNILCLSCSPFVESRILLRVSQPPHSAYTRTKFIGSFQFTGYLNTYYKLAWGCRYIFAHIEEISVGFDQPAMFVH